MCPVKTILFWRYVMARVKCNGIEIEYDTFGKQEDRPILLIMGLSAQMIAWHTDFCRMLAADGHFVVRFDNRDVGLSSKMEDLGVPDIMKVMALHQEGKPVEAPYQLSDMALDLLGLMDALDLEKAHICGLSMGGMIAQTLAIEHPERVLSLISMESTTGEPDLPPAKPEPAGALFTAPPMDREGYIAHMARVFRAFSGGSDAFDEAMERELSAIAFDRSLYPLGFVRQFSAILASGGRREALKTVTVPALVIHGADDPLLPLEHGKDTADAIPGARLLVVEGLGHGFSYPHLWKGIVAAITEHTAGVS
jgi:pimeloyl-ACP methyl ester carboxylesterase